VAIVSPASPMGIVGHARTGVSPLVVVDSVTAHQSTSSQPCFAETSLIEQSSCFHPDMLTLLDYDPAVPCVVAGGGGAYSSSGSRNSSIATGKTSGGKGKHSLRRSTTATATTAANLDSSSYADSATGSSSSSGTSKYYAMDTAAAARQQLLTQLQRVQLQQLEQQHKGLWGGLLLQ
jgi:hypothetical protein